MVVGRALISTGTRRSATRFLAERTQMSGAFAPLTRKPSQFRMAFILVTVLISHIGRAQSMMVILKSAVRSRGHLGHITFREGAGAPHHEPCSHAHRAWHESSVY